VGVDDDRVRGIASPYGMAVAAGRLYVTDPQINGLVIIDLREKKLRFFQPKGAGALRQPVNSYVDGEGLLYVADLGRGDVAIFDEEGSHAGAVGGDVEKPADVFVAHDRIWITDLARHQVRVYDRASGGFLFAFPEVGAPKVARLASPANLYVSDNAVYVSDVIRSTVQVYSLDGRYLRTIGSQGSGFGQFVRPKGVSVDREGRVYVVDAAFANVQIFDSEGSLLMFFGGLGDGPGEMVMPAKVVIDYDNLDYFRRFVAPQFDLKYLVFVTNQLGTRAVNVYGFVGPTGESGARRP
jgi:DNA-binding beta-propeller fold protein YncE